MNSTYNDSVDILDALYTAVEFLTIVRYNDRVWRDYLAAGLDLNVIEYAEMVERDELGRFDWLQLMNSQPSVSF